MRSDTPVLNFTPEEVEREIELLDQIPFAANKPFTVAMLRQLSRLLQDAALGRGETPNVEMGRLIAKLNELQSLWLLEDNHSLHAGLAQEYRKALRDATNALAVGRGVETPPPVGFGHCPSGHVTRCRTCEWDDEQERMLRLGEIGR